MTSLANLPQTAQQILNVYIEQLTAQGVKLPARRYVSPTQVPALDGEQFTIALAAIQQGQPGAPFGGSFNPAGVNQFATFSLCLARAVAILQTDSQPLSTAVPSAEQIGQDGALVIADAAALWKASAQAKFQFLLGEPGDSVEIGPVTPILEQGGLAGNRLLISLSVY